MIRLGFKIQHAPGFRLNLTDMLLLGALGATSLLWYRFWPDQRLYLLPLYVGGTFFLFCNVFRIGNHLEPVWYVTFAVLAGFGLTRQQFPWIVLLAICEPLKWALIVCRVRRGPYRGAFYRQLARFNTKG